MVSVLFQKGSKKLKEKVCCKLLVDKFLVIVTTGLKVCNDCHTIEKS